MLECNDVELPPREPVTGKPTTPLRLLIRQFPDLAERIFDRCVKANYHTDATTAWQANTKLDAAPISPDDPKFSGKRGNNTRSPHYSHEHDIFWQ